MRARTAGFVVGVVTAVLLFPVEGATVVDGDEEYWIRTAVGWAYRVPFDQRSPDPWFVFGLPIVGGLIAGFGAWGLVTLLDHPTGRRRTSAVIALGVAIVAASVIAITFISQPPSQYRHVF